MTVDRAVGGDQAGGGADADRGVSIIEPTMLPMPVRARRARAGCAATREPAALRELDVDQVGGAAADHLDEVADAEHGLVGHDRRVDGGR